MSLPIMIECRCPFCGTVNYVNVDPHKWNQYLNGGGLIQNIFPELSASQREWLMTGMCDDCFPSE